jgi:hypothetical protein
MEIRKHQGPLNKPVDLLRRVVSSEDFLDCAVIGGMSVKDILTGKVAEWQIPSNVIEAFHAQYPQHGASFVQAVNHLANDPDKLMGLVNGVKGKLFELDYSEWLNHGHLPEGWTAELAHHANNPGWDVVIHDAHGHVDQLLQLKALISTSLCHMSSMRSWLKTTTPFLIFLTATRRWATSVDTLRTPSDMPRRRERPNISPLLVPLLSLGSPRRSTIEAIVRGG